MNDYPELPKGLPGSLGQAVFRLIRERGLAGRSETDALDSEWKAVDRKSTRLNSSHT